MALGMGLRLGLGGSGRSSAKAKIDKRSHEILLQAQLLDVVGKSNEGRIIQALSIPWIEIFNEIATNPEFLFEFSKYPRKFEEFLAASYERAGWERVILTPQSGDGGRDVIAEKGGFGAIRILDQAKAHKKDHLVTHNDVRAMLGVLSTDPNATKVAVTTTSEFAPGILNDASIMQFVPNRLELRNGLELSKWLDSIVDKKVN